MAWLRAIVDRTFVVNLAVTAAAFAVFFFDNRARDVALRDVQFFNGWVLVACLAVLMLLTLRKRMVILPFGRVRLWLLLHIFVGFATIGVFLVHTKYRLPNAPLEWVLWSLFVIVAASGAFGILISKIIPPRLEGSGERVLFDRIPIYRARLAAEAETLARDSVRDGNTISVARLYTATLGHFFAGPRHVLAHLHASRGPLARILGEIASVERYLDESGRRSLARMRELVETKSNLDFHYANGALLRLWLFLHIPATYALLVIAAVHVMLAYAFSAG